MAQRGIVPRPRYRHGCVVIDDSMIVFGGVDKDQHRFNELAEFDFNTGVWSKLDTVGEIPTGRTFHKCRVWHGNTTRSSNHNERCLLCEHGQLDVLVRI